jgi:phosphonatase-like hydrolase
MSQIQLVVLDMAGTTIKDNNEVAKCFFIAAESTGLLVDPDQIVAMMGWSKKLVFETLWQQQIGQTHPDYSAKVEASFIHFKEVLEKHYETQPVEPTEGCLELFHWLKSQGVKIALDTGFYRDVTNIILSRLGWDEGLNQQYVGSDHSLIQASITPSEIFNSEGRPAPFMIQKAMYRLGITDPQSVLHIGDTPVDLVSGKNANCYSFGVTSGSHTREQLARYPNDGLLDCLRELPEKIKDLN